MITLSNVQVQTIKAGLISGHGLTKTAGFLHVHVRELSVLIKNDPAFKEMCNECIEKHVQAILSSEQSDLLEKQFDKYLKEHNYLSRFVTKLTLWEEHATKMSITRENFLKAMYLYKDPLETATACGMEIEEMYSYIKSDNVLSGYIAKINWLN